MKFEGLHRVLGITVDEVEVSDPWGAGMKFWGRPTNDPGYQKFVDQRGKQNPFMRKVQNEMGRRQIRAQALGDKLPPAEDLFKDILLVIADGEGDVTQYVQAMTDAFDDEHARALFRLLTKWEGVKDDDGKDVPLTEDAAVELFTLATKVPKQIEVDGEKVDAEYGGLSIGMALQSHITGQLSAGAALEAEVQRDAEKN